MVNKKMGKIFIVLSRPRGREAEISYLQPTNCTSVKDGVSAPPRRPYKVEEQAIAQVVSKTDKVHQGIRTGAGTNKHVR
jgi:hypothetical protein